MVKPRKIDNFWNIFFEIFLKTTIKIVTTKFVSRSEENRKKGCPKSKDNLLNKLFKK